MNRAFTFKVEMHPVTRTLPSEFIDGLDDAVREMWESR